MVVSSLARLQHRDTQLVDAVLEKAIRRMDEAYTRDLAAVCKVGGVWREGSQENGRGLHPQSCSGLQGGWDVEKAFRRMEQVQLFAR